MRNAAHAARGALTPEPVPARWRDRAVADGHSGGRPTRRRFPALPVPRQRL